MGSPGIDERMAALRDDDWSLLWHVAEPAPFTGACSGFSVGPLTQSECREFLARLREKLDGLGQQTLWHLQSPGDAMFSPVMDGLVSLGFIVEDWDCREGDDRLTPEGRAALRLEADRG